MLPLELPLEACWLFGLALLELPLVRAADEPDRDELARDRLAVLLELEPDLLFPFLDAFLDVELEREVPFLDVEPEREVEVLVRFACVRPRLFPRRDCPDWLETAI